MAAAGHGGHGRLRAHLRRPDNGIRTAAHLVPARRTKAVKYAYLDELAAFAGRGQSPRDYRQIARITTGRTATHIVLVS
jgi:hypothetical protein